MAKLKKGFRKQERMRPASGGAAAGNLPHEESCTALMIIDETPIRRRAISNCKRMITVCAGVERQIKRHENLDSPAYDRWLWKEFAADYSMRDELAKKRQVYEEKYHKIRTLRYTQGLSEREAFRLLNDYEENPDKYAGNDPFDIPEEEYFDPFSFFRGRNPFSSDQDQDEDEDEDFNAFKEETIELLDLFLSDTLDDIEGFLNPDELNQFIGYIIDEIFFIVDDLDDAAIGILTDEITSRVKNAGKLLYNTDDDQYDDDEHPPRPDGSNGVPESGNSRARYLYYQLVKKLHPDFCPDPTEEHRRVWQRAQDAYQRHDTEELEVLFARYEIHIKRDYSSSSTSEILAIHSEQKEMTKSLRRRLRDYQRSPAWKFNAISKKLLKRHRDQLQRRLDLEIGSLQREIIELENWLESLQQPPGSGKTARKKAETDYGQQDLFDDI